MDDSNVIELIGKVLVATVLMLLFVVVFLFFLHFYNKASRNAATAAATSTLFQFVAHGSGYEDDLTPLRRGLDPSVLKSIPMVSAEEMKEKSECAVCLCDISEGEKARLLPKCNHGFHVECIDMWFQSNSTCPICRNPVSDPSSLSSSSGLESRSVDVETTVNENNGREEYSNLSTNLQVRSLGVVEFAQASDSSTSSSSSSNGGMLVIDIPLQINEAAEEEEEEEEEEEAEANPPTPPTTRLSSFKRLLIRDIRVSPC